MELCGLPKARPIVWSDCPAFQRHHRSVICAAESLTRFPWAIDTTSEKKIYIRWCCTDLLRPPVLSESRRICDSFPQPSAYVFASDRRYVAIKAPCFIDISCLNNSLTIPWPTERPCRGKTMIRGRESPALFHIVVLGF